MYEDYDDCHCPGGVVSRVSGITRAAALFIVSAAALKILQVVTSSIIHGAKVTARAASRIDWQAVGMVTLTTVVLIVALFIWFVNRYSLKDEQPPSPLKKARPLRRFLMQRDLKKRMKARPELSTLHYSEVLEDMFDHHPKREIVTDPKVLEDYKISWEKVQQTISLN